MNVGDIVALECLGDIPGNRFLDGRTADPANEDVGLVRSSPPKIHRDFIASCDHGSMVACNAATVKHRCSSSYSRAEVHSLKPRTC